MRVYIHENKVVKTVNNDYILSEYHDPSWTHVDSLIDISEHIVFEDLAVKLYKDSNVIQERKAELEAKETTNDAEAKELEYILLQLK